MVTTWLTLEYNRRRDTAGTDVVDLSAPEGVNLGIARGGISGQNRSEVATALADPTRQRAYSANFRVEANLGPVDLTSISTYWNFRQTAPIEADGTSARLFDRSAERRVGRECVSTGTSRLSPRHNKRNQDKTHAHPIPHK